MDCRSAFTAAAFLTMSAVVGTACSQEAASPPTETTTKSVEVVTTSTTEPQLFPIPPRVASIVLACFEHTTWVTSHLYLGPVGSYDRNEVEPAIATCERAHDFASQAVEDDGVETPLTLIISDVAYVHGELADLSLMIAELDAAGFCHIDGQCDAIPPVLLSHEFFDKGTPGLRRAVAVNSLDGYGVCLEGWEC